MCDSCPTVSNPDQVRKRSWFCRLTGSFLSLETTLCHLPEATHRHHAQNRTLSLDQTSWGREQAREDTLHSGLLSSYPTHLCLERTLLKFNRATRKLDQRSSPTVLFVAS